MLDAPIVHQSILFIGEYRVVQPWPKIFTYLSCRNKFFQTCKNIGIQTLIPEVVGSTDDPLPNAGDTGSELALRRFVWNLTSQATMDKDGRFWQGVLQRIGR